MRNRRDINRLYRLNSSLRGKRRITNTASRLNSSVQDYGYDSNGEEIDESTVEELARITNEIINDNVQNPQWFEYIDVDEDSFKNSFYFSNGAHVNYELTVTTDSDKLDISDCYTDGWNDTFVQITQNNGYAVIDLKLVMDVQNADIKFKACYADVYELSRDGHMTFSQYYTDKFDQAIDINKVFDKVKACLAGAVEDALVTISNL